MSSKKRRNDVTTEIVVGAFMFVILMVLLTLTLVIGHTRIFERPNFMTVNFPDIGGLKTGEPVFLRGVRMGTVNEIIIPEDRRGVDVELRLGREVTLHEDYRFIIEPSSMLGGMRLVIEEGSETLPELPPPAYEDLQGRPVANLMDEATQTIQVIREALVEEGVLENLQEFSVRIRKISEKIDEGDGTIARLINEDGLYAEAQGMVGQLVEFSEDINVLSTRLVEGRGLVGKLLSEDEEVYTEFRDAMRNINAAAGDARKLLARLEAGEGMVGKLLSSDEEVYDDLRDTVASLREFTEALNEQQGTFGLLLSEDVLYRKVVALVDEARATIDDFRETSPITTFGSIFFGAF